MHGNGKRRATHTTASPISTYELRCRVVDGMETDAGELKEPVVVRAPRRSVRSATTRRRGRRRGWRDLWPVWLRNGVELAALLVTAYIAIVAALGRCADWFAGAGLWSHLLPFAGGVLGIGIATAALLRGWFPARRWLAQRWQYLPAGVALAMAIAAGWLATQPAFHRQVSSLQSLVGGSAEAERIAIAHQVFAAYRRSDLGEQLRILERGRVYEPTVQEAAAAFGVDAEVLMGVGAAESAFYPRDSADGGRGLFQITAPPAPAVAAARKQLHTDSLDALNQRHNAYVAAATLRRYLDEFHGDLFLGLLAYNIGPRNGGLRSIMKQYGARDFVTIQPYLQNLPRDYPDRKSTRLNSSH